MATQVRFRRGNSTQNDAFTGAEGEITVDTTNKSVRVHDGLTAGGTLLLSNTSATLYLNNLTGNIIPAQNVTYSLGNSTHRFKDIFLSGSSIDLGGVILKNESGFFKIVDNSGNNVPIRVYTANVIESGDTTSGNVYFTNARVYSAVTGNLALKANVTDLTTSNVTEGTNLYFTNARARQAISIIGSGSYDNTTGVITITGGVSSVGGATGNVSNNQLALAISNSGILTTSNVAEGTNLYYTNARVYAAVTGNLATKANVTDLTTSNVTEGTNLYYSNYRVYTAVTGNLALKANVTDLTTSNVTEGTNLYYTNARTYANVISLLPTYTGNVGGNMVGTYTNTSIIAGTAEFIFDNAGNVTVPNAIRANILYANTIQNLSTSNLIEGTNLYYTNARVYSNVVSLVTTSFVNNLNVNANFNNLTNLPSPGITVQLQGDVSGSASANITNLSQSNTILLTTTIQPNSVALGTDTTGPYVANLIAGTGVSLSGLGNEGTTPTISIGQDVSPTASVTFGNVVVTGNLQVLGNLSQLNVAVLEVEDNMIYLNANSTIANPDLGFAGNYNDGTYAHAGLFRDATDGTWKFYHKYLPEPDASPYIDTTNTSFTLANVQAFTVTGNNAVFSTATLSNITGTHSYGQISSGVVIEKSPTVNVSLTGDVTGSAERLLSNLGSNIINIVTTIQPNSVELGIDTFGKYVANVIQGTGISLLDTGDGERSNVTISLDVSGVAAGLYGSNGAVPVINVDSYGRVINVTNTLISAQALSGSLTLGTQTTGDYVNNVLAGTGLVASGQGGEAANVTLTLTTTGISASTYGGNGVIPFFTVDTYGRLSSAGNITLTTSNVIEGANLYYTNARVYANIATMLPTYTGNVGGNMVGAYTNTSIIAGTAEFIFDNAGNIIVPNAVRANILYANSIQNLTTSNLTEGTNLYYTNARVYAAVTGNLAAKANVTDLTTANVLELNNLYYTNARVYAAVTGNLATKANVTDLTTANVLELNNLYYTNARVYAAVTGNLATKANVSDLTTSNVTEGSNLYFTNARTYANVISLLPTYTGNVGGNLVGAFTNSSIIAGTYEFTFDNAGNVTVPNAIRANILYANTIQNLTTSNLTEGNNLYYTNARVYAAVTGNLAAKANVTDLKTANVAELTNLYFTNARVNAALSMQTLGNVTFGSTVLINNGQGGAGSDEGGQIDFAIPTTNSTLSGPIAVDIYQNRFRIFETTGTNRGVYIDLTTTGAAAGTNLIGGAGTITSVAGVTSGAVSNAQIASGISSSGILTTANVIEGANLYYTNARVYANTLSTLPFYTGNIAAANVYAGNITLLGNINVANIVGTYTNTSIFADTFEFIFNNAGNIIVPNAIRANIIYANTIQNLTTSNLIEGTNLYYTNARVYAAVTGNLATKANVTDLTTSNVTEGTNLYFTNTRAYANTLLAIKTGNGIVYDNTTGNITLSPSGVSATTYGSSRIVPTFDVDSYGRVTRAANVSFGDIVLGTETSGAYLANVIAGTGVTITNQGGEGATPTISIGQNVSPTANVEFFNVTITGNLNVTGNVTQFNVNVLEIEDNMIYLNANSTVSNPDLGFAGNYNDGIYQHAGLFRDATDGAWKFYDGYRAEPDASPFIDTANIYFRYANVAVNHLTAANSVTGVNANFTSNVTTGNVSGTRGDFVFFDGIMDSGTITSAVAVNKSPFVNVTLSGNITGTANVLLSNLTGNTLSITTALENTGVTAASYGGSNVVPSLVVDAKGRITSAGNVTITTSNVTEVNNLYFTNARTYANVISLLPTYTGNVSGNFVGAYTNTSILAGTYEFIFDNAGNVTVPNAIRANILYANTIQNLTTSNLIEGTNLYYTNARVYAAVTGNLALKANVTDLTTSNVTEGTNLYFTNARSYANVISLLPAYTGNISAANVYAGNITATGNINFSNLVGTYTNTTIVAGLYNFTFDSAGNVIVPNAVRANVIYANVIQNLTTSNLTEGTNLYFTNARAYANTILGLPFYTGNIAAANVYAGNVTITGNVNVGNLIGSSTNTTVVAGAFNFTFDSAGNVSIPNAVRANILYANTFQNITTSTLTEGTNLYFTNARSYANVISLLPTYTGNVGGNVIGSMTNTTVVAGTYEFIFDNAGNVTVPNAIRANILYANTIQNLTTSNLTEGTNLYFTNARVYSAVTGNLALKANVTDLTTSNVTEGSNLYFTNARVTSNVVAYLPSYTGNIGGNLVGAFTNSSIIAGTYEFTFDNSGNLTIPNTLIANTIVSNTITNSGTITCADLNTTSDKRLKENIEPITNALDKVLRLNGVYYNLISTPGKKQMGMIAQDAAEIVPEVVNQGNIWGVSYGHVVGLLVEAIKEQQNQIEDLKNQIKNK